MLRTLTAGLVTTAALLGATAAQAGTSWSIGINLPPAAVVVSDGPRYYAEPAPVYYAPPPVRYVPAPVRYVPAPRYVEREVVYVPPPRVVYERRWDDRRWDDRREHWHHERHEHRWEDRRDDYGPRRGR